MRPKKTTLPVCVAGKTPNRMKDTMSAYPPSMARTTEMSILCAWTLTSQSTGGLGVMAEVRDDGGGHGPVEGGVVCDADGVVGPGKVEEGEERAIAADLGVDMNDLLGALIGAVEELDRSVEGSAVSLQEELDAVH